METKGNVMIADDSESIRMVLKDILSIGDFAVIGEASDGAEAVKKYSKINPDVLLLDLAMPKKDGLMVVTEIINEHPGAKIILITASDNQKVIRQCLDAGASGYIAKPFEFDKVLKTISKFIPNKVTNF